MLDFKRIRRASSSLVERFLVPIAWGVGALYFVYFALATAGLTLMLSADGTRWSLDFTRVVIYVSCGLHFGFIAVAYVLIEGYDHAPVEPVWAFLFADYMQAGTLGATITAHALGDASRDVVLAAATILMGAQVLCFFKTISIVRQVRAGHRTDLGRLERSDRNNRASLPFAQLASPVP